MAIRVTSTAFRDGEAVPEKYTCQGVNISPPLEWSNVPDNSQSLALICEDPDAPSGPFVHWVLFNLRPQVASLEEGVPANETLEQSGTQGRNDFDHIGYGGPCPPSGKPHRYNFRLYALDTELELEPGATRDELTGAMEGHILAEGKLTGVYQKQEGRPAGS